MLARSTLTIAVLAAACTSDRTPSADTIAEDGVWTAETAWRIGTDPALVIEGSSDAVDEQPLDPVDVLRLEDGRILVADGRFTGHDGLLVYDRNGRFMHMWGGQGRGPGEFGQLFAASRFRGDSIAAYDFIDRGYEIFSLDGQHARLLPIDPMPAPLHRPGYTPNYWSERALGLFEDGTVLVLQPAVVWNDGTETLINTDADVYTYDARGKPHTRLGSFRVVQTWSDGRSSMQMPFGADGVFAVGREHLYYGTGDRFTIDVIDRYGSVVRKLARNVEAQPVTDEDREDFIATMVQQSSSGPEGGPAVAKRAEEIWRTRGHFAKMKPVYSAFVEDAAGNLWVEHFRWVQSYAQSRNPTPTRWSVFDPAGKFLGEVEVPARFLVSSITHDEVLGFYQDELDVKHVRVYPLIKPQRNAP